ncbi:TetR/AcrR family transcriptional regulator [Streptomyces sp. NBC_01304]|uniref:TetR/AcrR family transcriptional regulator n=1 Tax=Streptomyces sp. NBC_01304 TaxID=2903818 RepID=UPI002E0F9FC0|nr:TetR family transcriptional regulator [Streptomyces sp. NBC_01304]
MSQSQGPKSQKTAARGTYAVGDERRARILDTAVEHFAQWGFHASSLARIAKDVGITQGGLLHHFRSKEDLLFSVLERSEEHDVEQIFRTETHPTETHPARELCAAVLALAEVNTRRPGLVKMFNVLVGESGNPGHPAHAYFTARYDRVIDQTTEALRRAVAGGELKADTDCRAVAQEMIAVMDGLQIQWALNPRAIDMIGSFRGYLDRLLRSITVEEAGL